MIFATLTILNNH